MSAEAHPDPGAHLARIGLSAPPPATLEGLRTLQAAHMAHVPFENLDVRMGRALDLVLEALFSKIVTRRRGGYCFELNTLYGALLDALGFARHATMARVWYREPDAVPAQTHVCHVVRLDGHEWITDVGFGGRAPRVPVCLSGEVAEDAEGQVRARRDADHGYMVERHIAGRWRAQFSTTAAPAHASDLALANHWVETHPDSYFREVALAGLFTPTGRCVLLDETLTVREGEVVREEPVPFGAAWLSVLQERFGLRLGATANELARLAGEA